MKVRLLSRRKLRATTNGGALLVGGMVVSIRVTPSWWAFWREPRDAHLVRHPHDVGHVGEPRPWRWTGTGEAAPRWLRAAADQVVREDNERQARERAVALASREQEPAL